VFAKELFYLIGKRILLPANSTEEIFLEKLQVKASELSVRRVARFPK